MRGRFASSCILMLTVPTVSSAPRATQPHTNTRIFSLTSRIVSGTCLNYEDFGSRDEAFEMGFHGVFNDISHGEQVKECIP